MSPSIIFQREFMYNAEFPEGSLRSGEADIRRVRVTRQKILDRARDELFSHVNRCGVLQAAAEDQEQWMNETIEYLGERFPDLTDGDLPAVETAEPVEAVEAA